MIVLILAALLVIGVVVTRFARKPESAPPPATNATGTLALDKIEAEAARRPNDAEAWRKLGQAYFGERRFADAARAYEHATGLNDDDASLWSALGEARVMASEHDPMPPAASTAFDKALALDPADPRARYFRAVRQDLEGDHEAAIASWLKLLGDTPADAPWHDDLVRTIEQVGKIHRIDVTARIAAVDKANTANKALSLAPAQSMPKAVQGIPGPSEQDLARASAMRPSEQQAMAEGMVASLAQRLRSDPSNLDGWVMMIRSRVMLDQRDLAARALADAIAANPAKAGYLRQQAALLDVK